MASRPAPPAGPPYVIGWWEYVDLPGWGVTGLRAKVDTGAATSALDVAAIRELPGGRVRFDVVLDRRSPARRVRVETAVARRGVVRASTGEAARRIFVRARLRLGPVEREVEVSLVDRGRMRYRMLLGRGALAGRFVVDVARCRVCRKTASRRARPHRRSLDAVR
jgi:hypothetical protein